MSVATAPPSRSSATVIPRLVWPIAALLIVTLGVLVAALFWVSGNTNEIAAERQRHRAVDALGERLDDQARRLLALVAGEAGASSSAAPRLLRGSRPDGAGAECPGFDATLLVSGSGDIVAGAPNGRPSEAVPAALTAAVERMVRDHREALAAAPRDAPAGRARLMQVGEITFAVVSVPLMAEAGPAPVFGGAALAIAFQKLDELALAALARNVPADRMWIERSEVSSRLVSIPIRDASDHVAAHLVWPADRPGDLILHRLGPMALLIVSVLALVSLFVFGHVQRVAIDLARAQERAQQLAGHDALSGLPNRRVFGERLDRELARMNRGGDGVAVLCLDLDRFKEVNDTFGHEAGDELIKQVAHRLSDLLRGADTLARFGGDEFAIIQTGVRAPRDAEALARRILDAIARPFQAPCGAVHIGVSIGVALGPDNASEREPLLRLADAALYQAKNDGRNRYGFFEPQMNEALRLRKIVEDDLRAAIARDELVLHYQPFVSADGKKILGVEALVRWPHPRHGLISPAQFIGVAEERGLIIPLGEWVLRRACRDARRWPHLLVAVNVSPIQFRHRNFVEGITAIIEEAGIDPTRLELELTESVVLEDADAAEAAMIDLRAFGVRLALDDFGTGYSSLIYLRRFAFDKIKIDRSFLESMEQTGESAILVHSVVHLGRALGLTVTAEGVETSEQHRLLQAIGCHELQGFLFSKPVPADDIDRLVSDWAAGPRRTAA